MDDKERHEESLEESVESKGMKENNQVGETKISEGAEQKVPEKLIIKSVSQVTKEPSESEKEKKNHTPLIIVFAVLVVCAVAVLAYYVIWNNPKNIFLNAVNSEYQTLSNKLTNLLDQEINMSKEDVVTSTGELNLDIKASSELQDPEVTKLLEEFSKLNLSVNSGIDRKNKEFSTEILLNSEKDSLLNVGVYGTKKNMYIELKNLLNKFIEIPLGEEYDSIFNNQQSSIDDIDYIVNITKDSFLKNLDKKDFKQSKETIKVDKKEVKVTKTSYELNDITAKVLVEKMIKDLKKDQKFVEKVASISGMKESEVKEDMNNTIKEMKEDKASSDDVVVLSIYTKGMMNEALAYEIDVKDKYSESNIRYTKGNTSTIVYTEDKKEQFNITAKKEGSNKTKITVDADGIIATVTAEDKGDSHKYVYTLSEKDSDMKMYGTLTTKTKEITKNKKYQQNMDFEMFMDVDSIEKALTFKVNTKGTTAVGKGLKIPDVKNAVTTDQLTEQDMTTIMTNLSKNTKLMEFVNTVSSLF